LLDIFKLEKKGYIQPMKIDGVTLFRALENRHGTNKKTGNQVDDDFKDPCFNNFEEAFKGVRHKYEM